MSRREYKVRCVHNRVEHWDVNNENMHGDFFEQHTGNINITMDMFRDAHAVDPHAKLFLNEYGILENTYTMVSKLEIEVGICFKAGIF